MKYHIIVFGCQMNTADAERLSETLEKSGYKKTAQKNEADLIVVVMCSVRQSAVDRVHWLAHKFSASTKKPVTVLTGCILEKDKKKFTTGFDYVVDIKNEKEIKKIVRECDLERTSQGDLARSPSETRRKSPRIERAAAGPRALAEDHFSNDKKFDLASEELASEELPSGYIPIMTGCNNFCSYCVVPYTRGREVSFPAKKIISEVKKALKNGAKEIWLLGQNVNSYKDPSKNMPANFPKLLKMVNDLPGNFVLNFTSSHPKDFSDELIETMAKCEKLSMDLNLPIQSGDDAVLKRMNRPYTVAQYKNLVKKIRKVLPKIRLSTDIIVGFPGETKKEFTNTVKTLKEIGYGVAFVNKYSPRAGTAAAKMKDDVSWEEKKSREKVLINLINARPTKRQPSKLIVITGPTASGKTDLSIKLAKKFDGEIISADSRQVYKGMDVGSAKITKKEMRGIPHYLLDVASPKKKFTVAQYQKMARKAIQNIYKKNKVPFLVGGSAFYINSVVDGVVIPEVRPDWELRKNLEKLSVRDLFLKLKKLDPARAKTIDKNNPRRLIRALEIILKTKKPIPTPKPSAPGFNVLKIGVKKDKEQLKNTIHKRLLKRLQKNAIINEVKKLRKSLSWERLEEFGMEYRYVAQYLQGKITRQQMIEHIEADSWRLVKKQMVWFKKDSQIKWVNTAKEAERLCKEFLLTK